MRAAWWVLALAGLLVGCVSDAPLSNAPCPCLEGQTCCALTGLCVADGVECPSVPDAGSLDMTARDAGPADGGPVDVGTPDAVADRSVEPDAAPPIDARIPPDARLIRHAVTLEPAVGPHQGGTTIRLTVEPPFAVEHVTLGGRPCLELAPVDDGWQCVTPVSDGIAPRVDVVVEGSGERAIATDGFHYRLPAFSDVTMLAGVHRPDPLEPQIEGHSIVPFVTERGLELLLSGWRGPDYLRHLGGLRFSRARPRWVDTLPATFKAGAFDADADGRLDVFFARRTGDMLTALWTLYRATDDGAFADPLGVSRSDGAPPAPALVPVDVDGDGDLDLVGALGDNPDQPFAWFRNDDGAFVMLRIAPFDAARARVHDAIVDVELVDFDKDGWVDVFACGDQAWFLRGGPDGFEEATAEVEVPALSLPCGDLEIGDLDGDGWFDLIVVPETGRQGPQPRATGVAAFFNVRGERLETRGPYQNDEHAPRCPGVHYMHHMVRMGAGSLLVIDADLDGALDFFLPQSASTCPGMMSFYRAELRPDKLVYAGEAVVPGHHTSASGALAYDFDRDGDLDVLSHGFVYSEGPRLLRNNAVENAAPETLRWLRLTVLRAGRQVPGSWVEIDLDGPADAPDWASGPGRLRLLNLTDSALDGHRGAERLVGLGDAQPPYHVRVHFPGGVTTTARIDAPNQDVLIDPAAE